jgi:hypothetical protein
MIHIAYVMPIPKVDMGLPFFARFPDEDSIYFKLHHPDSKHCVGYCYPPPPEQSSDRPWSYLSHLPKRLDCEIIALAVCLEENDLVALVCATAEIKGLHAYN